MQTTHRMTVGIHDIAVYVPSPYIRVDDIARRRTRDNPRLERHLERAIKTTGQRMIRFPEPWEDTATMAAQASSELLGRSPIADVAGLRHLAVGTESGVDHSKPLSAYVQGMLMRSGLPIPNTLSSFQVQHACAGGTMAMLSTGSMLAAGGCRNDTALVASADIARYETESTAEITQGAGAAALLLGFAPRLLEIDFSTVGYWSADVDDFFRPLGSPVARVKGGYSMKCYAESLDAAFLDHCRRAGEDPRERLGRTELFALHTPFRNMPENALQKLLEKRLSLDDASSRAFLLERGFYGGVDPIADIGNMYTASLWTAAAFLLYQRFKEFGERIVGKRMALASYGSGNTMAVIDARVAPGAPEVIERWRLERVFETARESPFSEYARWTAMETESHRVASLFGWADVPSDRFILAGVREDDYREYRTGRELADWTRPGSGARESHETFAVSHAAS